jgi:hypothetical protein
VPTIRPKRSQSVVADPKPTASGIFSTDAPLVSRTCRARRARQRTSQRAGVSPVVSDELRWIRAGTIWGVAHHLWGNPIMPVQATSSAGCAIMDALIAIWFLRGAPSVIPGRDTAAATNDTQLCVMLRSTIWRMPPCRR